MGSALPRPEGLLKMEYVPREQFVPFHKRKQRHSVLVTHRRCGKTVASICDNLEIVDGPIHTAWDLGHGSNMAIFAFQIGDDGLLVHDFIQEDGWFFTNYIEAVKERGYTGKCYVPHDIQREKLREWPHQDTNARFRQIESRSRANAQRSRPDQRRPADNPEVPVQFHQVRARSRRIARILSGLG